ncbi:hypothetical protein [Aquabacterium olei]|uniref:hypothetical protein n=1 Tax=Aquabacterium olei TaxID=1296669 RepID=UPI00131F1176|nr:hypothetical protein [Aquabacterium olei]
MLDERVGRQPTARLSGFQPGCAARRSEGQWIPHLGTCPEINRTPEMSPPRLKAGQWPAGMPVLELSDKAINEGQIEYTVMP